MCQKCVFVAKSSAQGPGPESRMWIQHVCKMWSVSQIRCDPIRFNSENVSKVYNCRRIQRPGSRPRIRNVSKVHNCRQIRRPGGRSRVQNVSKMWPVSQIQGPRSRKTALREKEPGAGSTQIWTPAEPNRVSNRDAGPVDPPVTPC